MKIEDFKELIEEFVTENFRVEGTCESCDGAYTEPDDWKGSYDIAIKELFKTITSTSLKALIKNK